MPPTEPPVTVVGLGASGAVGLAPEARAAVADADAVIGSQRQLALVDGIGGGERVLLPSPLVPALPGLLETHRGRRLVVLASGDPMFFGIGSTVLRLLDRRQVRVLPHPSSVSLAAAQLGWPLETVEVLSVVGRPPALLHPLLAPGRRILVLTPGGDGARVVRAALAARGYAASAVTVLTRLGGPEQTVGPAGDDVHDPLAIVAVECVADAGTAPLTRTAALPDDAFEHDGQLTKREIRALTMSSLVPLPGQLLWDVGAGSGSIGIEWMRTHPSCRAIAVEPRADRRERIVRNADVLGVPGLQLVEGTAPAALDDLPAPDAVFVGGGVSVPGVLEACSAALAGGGRLVANGVTVETEAVLGQWHARLGGSLTRVHVERASAVGGFTGWRPAMPVTQWVWTRA